MLLVNSSPVSLLRDHGRPDNLGVLIGPRGFGNYPQLEAWRWAADNDAFLAWDEGRFRRMLGQIEGLDGCLFVACPDVVGDAHATLARFEEWAPIIHAIGQPVAFVAQDGIEGIEIPWDDVDALFIGGTTDFKLGPAAAAVGREAKRLGKWLHMGRVNTWMCSRAGRAVTVNAKALTLYRRRCLGRDSLIFDIEPRPRDGGIGAAPRWPCP